MAANWLTCSSTRLAPPSSRAFPWSSPSWDLTDRQVCDLELLLNGSFSPLRGFIEPHRLRVGGCADMRLADGTLWPMPITLDISEDAAEGLAPGMALALRDPEGVMLAVVHIEDVWRPDRQAEAKGVFGTESTEHPGVGYLVNVAPAPSTSGASSRGSNCPSITTSTTCARARRRPGPSSPSRDGNGSWPSRRATRCTGPTSSSPCGPPPRPAPTCSSTRWWA